MSIRYIPNLRWKRGEKNALSDLTTSSKTGIWPLFLLGADQFKPRKATKTKPPVPASVIVATDIQSIWGQSPFYLDASPISPTPGSHRFIDIASECRSLGLNLIPATRLGVHSDYENAVLKTASTDGRGVCLRIDLQEMTTMASWVSAWPVPMSETDILVDFGDQVTQVAALGPSLNHAFQTMYQGNAWRSATIAGTSMPENFMGLNAGLHTIDRREKKLWEQLTTSGLPFNLNYGDYASVTTAAPPPGIAWGYPISVRYTLDDAFLICRGVRTMGAGSKDMDIQLVGHAQSINKYPGRHPLGHCWADIEIDAIAARSSKPQGLEHWVRIGVNRHIELVRATLP
jgi:hypothetical protein